MANIKIGQYKKEIAEGNKKNVFKILNESEEKLSTREIWHIMDNSTQEHNKKIELEAQSKYEADEITKNERDKIIEKKTQSTIDIRTIQRIIKEDDRLEKEGTKYFISPLIKDPRLLDPIEFGKEIYDTIIGIGHEIPEDKRDDQYYIKELNDFIIKIGCFITFMFIEATLPFNDEGISIKKRQELVCHWIKNSIPYEYLFDTFRLKFDIPKRRHDWKTPFSEIKQPIIDNLLKSLQDLYPTIHERYTKGKKRVQGKRDNVSNIRSEY